MKRALLALAGAACVAAATCAVAQSFPSHPVKVVVPWPPSGNVDITARTVAPALGEALGAQVIVENVAGAGGRIGTGAYPLGIKPDLTWPVETNRLEPGEALLLHSDGLSEARNPAGDEFGDARIEAAARSGIGLSPQELADALAGQARAFRGGEAPEDDVSIAILKRFA